MIKLEVSDHFTDADGRRRGKSFEFGGLDSGIARALASATFQEVVARGNRPAPPGEGDTGRLIGIALAFEEIGGGVAPGTEGIRDAVYGAYGIES